MDDQVFISYSQPDMGIAYRVHDEIVHRGGIRCWIDQSGIKPGESYTVSIPDAIESCRVLVLIYSRHCNNSEHVPRELDLALDRKKMIIPFMLDNSRPGKLLEYALATVQAIHVSDSGMEMAVDALISRLHTLLKIKSKDPEETTDRILYNKGLELLRTGFYQDAAKRLNSYLSIKPNDIEARFYLSIAIIAGRKTRKLDGLEVKKLESILRPAVEVSGYDYGRLLLAIIKQGYYRMNGMFEHPPMIDDLVNPCKISKEKWHDIISLLKDPENDIWRQLKNNFQP